MKRLILVPALICFALVSACSTGRMVRAVGKYVEKVGEKVKETAQDNK